MTVMLIAGEPSGDSLGAELVRAFRDLPEVQAMPWPPEFIGAGGPQMAGAGVRLEVDLTTHAVFGISDVLRHYLKFRGIFDQLLLLAQTRQPEVIILIDFGGFNLRFASAVKQLVRSRRGPFANWQPKIVYFVSPQVWASRAGRAYRLGRDVDLLLSIFPFEKAWYAARVPKLRVEFVGHPLVDRYSRAECRVRSTELEACAKPGNSAIGSRHLVGEHPIPLHPGPLPQGEGTRDSHLLPRSVSPALVLLLPGSRKRELEAHLPVIIDAARRLRANRTIRLRMVVPNADLAQFASRWIASLPELEVRTDTLADSLAEAHLAIASSGTVTLECAFLRVPTIVLYKTSWLTYQIARRIVTVKFIAMPNLLAGEPLFPEFIQDAATSDAIAEAALTLLNNPVRSAALKARLAKLADTLGEPGASRRAAQRVLDLLNP